MFFELRKLPFPRIFLKVLKKTVDWDSVIEIIAVIGLKILGFEKMTCAHIQAHNVCTRAHKSISYFD